MVFLFNYLIQNYCNLEVLNVTGALKDVDGGAKLQFIKKFQHLRILEIGSNQIRSDR